MDCYLCGASEHRLRDGAVRDDPGLSILECAKCGLVALSETEQIAKGHYEDSGMHGAALPPMETWLRTTEEDDRRRLEILRSSILNKTLLDFGSGACGFLKMAEPFASRVSGVEPERRVREHYAGELELFGSVEEAGTSYDVITAFHVVEHLPDPRAMLRLLGERLASNGRLVVEVPNSDDALLTLYKSSAFQHFTYWSQHLYLFNERTLRQLAEQARLRVVAVQQYQRYPLSNHLHWLSHRRPGGHVHWSFLDSPALEAAYAASLAAVGKCDTIVAFLEQ